jgi:hypothetical protein
LQEYHILKRRVILIAAGERDRAELESVALTTCVSAAARTSVGLIGLLEAVNS